MPSVYPSCQAGQSSVKLSWCPVNMMPITLGCDSIHTGDLSLSMHAKVSSYSNMTKKPGNNVLHYKFIIKSSMIPSGIVCILTLSLHLHSRPDFELIPPYGPGPHLRSFHVAAVHAIMEWDPSEPRPNQDLPILIVHHSLQTCCLALEDQRSFPEIRIYI